MNTVTRLQKLIKERKCFLGIFFLFFQGLLCSTRGEFEMSVWSIRLLVNVD